MRILIPILFTFLVIACEPFHSSTAATGNRSSEIKVDNHTSHNGNHDAVRAYFASGCFWCVEAIYEHAVGVNEVISGYSGGHTENPTYESSNTGKTGHAEAVEIRYNHDIISFEQLVDIYFATQNIEQQNGQGNDIGSQYRSIIFYQNDKEKSIIDSKIKAFKDQGIKVAAEVKKFEKFWIAEDYHQDYEQKHPNHPYIKAVSVPRLNSFKKSFPDLVK